MNALNRAANILLEPQSEWSAIARERRSSREHFIRNTAKLIDIGAAVDAITSRLFRRHVAWIAKCHAEAGRGCLLIGVDKFGEPEIEQLDKVGLAAAC